MKTHNRHLIILVTLAAILIGLENWGWGQEKAGAWAGTLNKDKTYILVAMSSGKFTVDEKLNSTGIITPGETEYDYIGDINVAMLGDAAAGDKSRVIIKYTSKDFEPIKFNGLWKYESTVTRGIPFELSVEAPSDRVKPTLQRYPGYVSFFMWFPEERYITNQYASSIKGDATTGARFIIDGGCGMEAPEMEGFTDYSVDPVSGGTQANEPLIFFASGMIKMKDVTIQNNWSNTGGSIAQTGRASAILFECPHTDNERKTLLCEMDNCIIDGCYSGDAGAAISVYNINPGSYLKMNNCTVQNCFANGAGNSKGGIVRMGGQSGGYNLNTCYLEATNCTFKDNYNRHKGGAICWPCTSNNANTGLTLKSCTFTNNHGSYEGGAIFCPYLALEDCTIQDNKVYNINSSSFELGGGIQCYGPSNGLTGNYIVMSGVMVVKDNQQVASDGSTKPSDVCLDPTGDRVVHIGSTGLDCGSCIGFYQAQIHYRGYDEIAIASGTAAQCLKAYRNHFFFDDEDVCDVFNTTASPYYNNTSSETLFFVRKTIAETDSGLNSWHNHTASTSSDCTIEGGFVTEVKSAAGLAYFSKDVLTKDYSGKTVNLTVDIDLSGHNWEPIGCRDCNSITSKVFKGTFDGQGHTISGLTCPYPYYNVGLFGAVGDNGIVKNTFVEMGSLSSSSHVDNLGGLVADLQSGGKVINCAANVTSVSGASTTGGLVGNNAGTVANCYVNTSISNSLVGANAGTVENCYVRGTTNKVGSGTAAVNCYASTDGSDGDYTAVVKPYVYSLVDNYVRSTSVPLVKTLNNWVDSHSGLGYAHWARPTTITINGDYPILKMPGSNAVAANSSTPNQLHYGDVDTRISTYRTANDAIYLYESASSVASNSGSSAKLYIDENAAITQAGAITANVGVTLKNTQSGDDSWDWHMFSSVLTEAPLGIDYQGNTTQYSFEATNLPHFSHTGSGYFPTAADSYYREWDYYCYFEPQYHWINFKRNGPSHWHEDAPNGTHEHINYVSAAGTNVNETTLTPGKGYLLATKRETLLQCEGTLNKGNVSINVSKSGEYRTGYNFLGNPYQSYLDFDAFATYNSGGNDNRMLWNGNSVSNASYIILDKDGYHSYAYNSSKNTFGANRYLHPHQGFMIIVKGSGTTATFTDGMRNITATGAFRDEQPNYPLVNLIATDAEGKRDITTVELGRPDKGGAIKAYDLHLGKGCIYTHYEDEDYAIAFTQPGLTQVGIRFEADEEATFTMTWDTENGEFGYLHLIDNITGTDTDCLSATEYHFSATPDDYQSRFKLVFDYTGVEENEEEDGPSTSSGTFAFQMGDQLVVNGEGVMRVFDMTGRMMMERSVNGAQTTIALPDLPSGVYALQLKGANGTQTQKIVIKR